MDLFYKPSALRIIKKFNKQEKNIFNQVLADLLDASQVGGFLKGSLVGLRKWKFRIHGVPYRIVYRFDQNRLEIIAVGKRKDFYELIGQ